MLEVILAAFSLISNDLNAYEYLPHSDIAVYEQRLEKFNEQYGTSYEIPDGSDIVEFYTSMTLKEFDKYIMSIYDGSFYDTEAPSVKTETGWENLGIEYEIPIEDNQKNHSYPET